MQPTDIGLLASASRPSLDPGANLAVFSVTRPNLEADAYVGQLWVVPVDGSEPARRITRGFHDSAPQFSPDGSSVAFIRNSADGPGQLFLVASGGGEPLALTDQILGVSEFSFSPDGSRLAFVARVPEAGRYGSVEGREASAESPRRITTLKYKSNGVGYTTDRRAQVFVLDTPELDGEPVYRVAPSDDGIATQPAAVVAPHRVTTDDASFGSIDWSIDGSAVLAVAAVHPDRDTDLLSQLVSIDVDSTSPVAPVALTPSIRLAVSRGAQAADGALWVLAQDVGADGQDFVAAHTGLYRIAEPGAEAIRLTDAASIDLDTELVMIDENHVLVTRISRGGVQLLLVSSDGIVESLLDGDPTLTDGYEVLGVAAAPGAVVVTVRTADSMSEVATVGRGGLSFLTDFGRDIRSAGVLPSHELVATAQDGSPVHGWVVLPEGEGPHPVLLTIHGGPFSQYVATLFDEAQVYAAAGYAVVLCNPRGSSGYGYDHGRAVKNAMGTIDASDVLDFLDAALDRHPSLDSSRVGIQGGSYGGYLTAWTIAHERRFAAAIVERGYLDPEAFIGTSDIGTYFGQQYNGFDLEAMRAQSPQSLAHLVVTPTLVMHSADDLRCPLGQAERYYATLKGQGVEAEMLIFPGENHELSRSGRPRHRVQRFDAILDWWARYLPTASNS